MQNMDGTLHYTIIHVHFQSVYVTGYGKTYIVHTFNFSTLVTHKISYELKINMKFAGIVEPLFFYYF